LITRKNYQKRELTQVEIVKDVGVGSLTVLGLLFVSVKIERSVRVS